MKIDFRKRLKREVSENTSGVLYNLTKIPILKEKNYCIIPFNLDGDAPKRFIKAYFYESGGSVYKSKFKTWPAFIAKSAQKWYPNESVIEYFLNKVGIEIGLNMNQVNLCRINGQIRFLSKYFLSIEEQKLIHGAEICGEYLEDEGFAKQIANDKSSARQLFTIQFIFEAINSVFTNCCNEIIEELVKMVVFDAIVGNNDRHFYNWGVIKSVRNDDTDPTFSPVYDTARGMLWNWNDDRVRKQLTNLSSGGKTVENYINNACPRISIEGNPDINHFDLVSFIWSNNAEYRGTISDLFTLEKENNILHLYNNEFKQYFIDERNELVCYIIKERFKKLREIVKIHD